MRGKRSKQYRKLMQQYSLHFGFREPYQILLDGAILEDAARFKMDFVSGLSKALHGQIKPMLTTCSIRHLSTRNTQDSAVMEHARNFERRRCGHHTFEEPLSEFECIKSVVDPKDSHTNKFKLVVASQDDKIRTVMRGIPGVPLIYIKRSVMVMEPMGGATEQVKERDEKSKFRAGLKGSRGAGATSSLKRKRDDLEGVNDARVNMIDDIVPELDADLTNNTQKEKKRRKAPGPKGPNPLSMKKAKSKNASQTKDPSMVGTEGQTSDPLAQKKRKRNHKSGQMQPPNGATTQDAGDET